MFAKVLAVLRDEGFRFDDKDRARRYFLELRQLFIDLNYLKPDSPEFAEQEKRIEAKLAEGR